MAGDSFLGQTARSVKTKAGGNGRVGEFVLEDREIGSRTLLTRTTCPESLDDGPLVVEHDFGGWIPILAVPRARRGPDLWIIEDRRNGPR
jgi:hypothetical protein